MPSKLLLLITDLELGGTPTVVRELAIRLQRTGAEVQVACLSKWGPVADQLRDAGIPVTALGARGATDFRILPRLIQEIRRHQISTVFSFLIHANAIAAAASLRVQNVRFFQAIQTTQPTPRWHWWLQRLIYRRAEKIVVPSKSVAEVAACWSSIPVEKLVVIPNAIDLADWASVSSEKKIFAGPPYPITFLGRLDRIKDVPTLIKAVSLLGDLVHLHIYGEGEDRQRIEQAIVATAAKVTLHGKVALPQAVLEKSAALILPSLAEGFGLVLIEAMSAGVPVVATNVRGIRDVITDQYNGVLVECSNAEVLANAIRSLLDDSTLRDRLIKNGIADVRTRFNWQAVLPQYQSLLGL